MSELPIAQWHRFDAMRKALMRCSFLPGHPHKRFVKNIAAVPIDKITLAQARHIMRLCWRYRRQIPHDLVPSETQVKFLDQVDREVHKMKEWEAARSRARKPPLIWPDLPRPSLQIDLFGR